MLNELDKELEARNLHFIRYADDCVIVVKSSAAASRVMHTVTNWIERKLGLKVNASKTKVTKPSHLKYLGFGFVKMGDKWQARPHADSLAKFKRTLKRLTSRSWGISMDERIPFSYTHLDVYKRQLMEYGRNYQTYKPIQDEYRQIRWKGKQEKFAEARRAELTLWDAANRYLHANLPKGHLSAIYPPISGVR